MSQLGFSDVEFVAKLRDELKFDNLDLMVEQIHRDAENARAILQATIGAAA